MPVHRSHHSVRRRHITSVQPELEIQHFSEELKQRAQDLFDIDIELSLLEWMTKLAPKRAVEFYSRHRETAEGTDMYSSYTLTPRQREVLSYAASGYTIDETAGKIRISPETVKTLRKQIRERLGVDDITHSVVVGLVIGEIDIDILQEHLFRGLDTVRSRPHNQVHGHNEGHDAQHQAGVPHDSDRGRSAAQARRAS